MSNSLETLERWMVMRRLTLRHPRAGAVLCLLLSSAAAALSAQTPVRSAGTGFDLEPPGRLVDLGGYRLHLYCAGPNRADAPTIVLSAGSGEYAVDWALVQPVVAESLRVCSYDRAGEGWSDPGPVPRTFRQEVAELRMALVRAGERGPYVVVGYSIGGLIAREFVAEYPGEVSGLVLLSPTSEDAILRVRGQVVRVRALAKDRPLPPVHTLAEAPPPIATGPAAAACQRRAAVGRIEAPYDELPATAQQYHLWSARHSACLVTSEEEDYLADDMAAMYARHAAGEDSLGTRPVIVIEGTKPVPPPPGVSAEYWERNRLERLQQLADLARLSNEGCFVADARAGHHVQLDDPPTVIDAIRQVAAEQQTGGGARDYVLAQGTRMARASLVGTGRRPSATNACATPIKVSARAPVQVMPMPAGHHPGKSTSSESAGVASAPVFVGRRAAQSGAADEEAWPRGEVSAADAGDVFDARFSGGAQAPNANR